MRYFSVYSCIPACPGHSEDRGRTERHILWEISDMTEDTKKIFENRVRDITVFRGIAFNPNSNGRSLTKLIELSNAFTATEMKALRSVMVYAVNGLVSDRRQDLWLDHVEKAAGYDKESWTTEEAFKWASLGIHLQRKTEVLFTGRSVFKNPKHHDPQHDIETLTQFGSFRNLDEMNFEQCHQIAKNEIDKSNYKNLEQTLLLRVCLMNFHN